MACAVWMMSGLFVADGMAAEMLMAESRSDAVIQESFDSLQAWTPLTFPKIARHSQYTLQAEGQNLVLQARADASASALVHTTRFAVARFPMIRWRWKIDSVLKKGDATTRTGDDYPIRVYVIFEFDPQQASFVDRLKYGAARAIYGQYPPHSSLNYIWANREHAQDILTNTYTDRARMFPLQQGDQKAGKWVVEQRNILADYHRAFGWQPPQFASIAIMADTDTTGESSTAWVDDLTVFR
jgi:hypothetical protein